MAKLTDIVDMIESLRKSFSAMTAVIPAIAGPQGQQPGQQALQVVGVSGGEPVAVTMEEVPGAVKAGTPPGSAPGDKKGAGSSFGDLAGALGKITGASAVAFGAMTATMGGFIAASSPILSGTLSKSFTLLGATVGTALIGPVIALAAKVQDLAAWFKNLDSSTKETIGTWAGWAAAVTGGAMVVGRLASVVGGLLPLLAGMRTAMVFSVANPFGALIAGLGAMAAFRPEMFAGIGKAISDAFSGISWGPILETLTSALTSFANAAASVLGPALNALATVINVISSALSSLGSIMGSSAGQVLAMGAAFAFLISPMRLLITGLLSLSAGLAGARSAWTAFTVSLAANPIGLVAIALAAVTTALLAQAGAFDAVISRANAAAAANANYKATLDRLKEGGKPTTEEVGNAMNDRERSAYTAAKTDEERRKVIEDASARTEKWKKDSGFGSASPEQLDRSKLGVQSALNKAIGHEDITEKSWQELEAGAGSYWGSRGELIGRGGAARRLQRNQQLRETLKTAGLSESDAETAVHHLNLNSPAEAKLLEKEKLNPEDVKKITDVLIEAPLKAATNLEVLKKALTGGTSETPIASKETTRLQRLEAMKSGLALDQYKEMMPQKISVESARSAVQQKGLGESMIDAMIAAERRSQYPAILQAMAKSLKNIETKNPTIGK